MISSTFGDVFRPVVEADMDAGERLVNFAQAYSEMWDTTHHERGGASGLFQQLDWVGIALTNVNWRIYRWRMDVTKGGWFKHKGVLVPEIVDSYTVPLASITSHGVRRYTPGPSARAHLADMFDTDVGEVIGIRVDFPDGETDVSSPLTEFETLAANLEATLSGTALASRTASVADALGDLDHLRTSGILTDEEFERAKSGFVGASVEVVESSAALLRQLDSLREAGILTESEFRAKKWDASADPADTRRWAGTPSHRS